MPAIRRTAIVAATRVGALALGGRRCPPNQIAPGVAAGIRALCIQCHGGAVTAQERSRAGRSRSRRDFRQGVYKFSSTRYAPCHDGGPDRYPGRLVRYPHASFAH